MLNLHLKNASAKSELDQKINAAIKENRKLSEHLSAFDPKTITDTVINTVQGNYQSSKPTGFAPKQFNHHNSMANHVNHNSFLVWMVR